jgi:hypothetical protein
VLVGAAIAPIDDIGAAEPDGAVNETMDGVIGLIAGMWTWTLRIRIYDAGLFQGRCHDNLLNEYWSLAGRSQSD